MRKECFLVLALALLVAGAAWAAGGGEGQGTPRQMITVSLAHWDIDKSITGADDPVYNKVQQAVGVQITPVPVGWGDWHEKVNVWAASGELPDAFVTDVVGTQVFRNWVTNAVIQPLPATLKKYPRVEAICAAGDYLAYQIDGKNWFIPRANYPDPNWWANDRGVLIRTDWLDKLKLKMPQTREEFIKAMVAFAKNDPDGNGVNDTIGLTTVDAGFLWGAFMEVAPNLAWGSWVKEEGRWVNSAVAHQTFELYSVLRDLYQRGGLDPDFAVQEDDDARNKLASGKAGALAVQVAAKHWDKVAQIWKSLHPETPFEDVTAIVPERPDANGQRWRFITASYWSETYLNAKASAEKVDAILRLYDYLMTDEFKAMNRYGIEGVDYKKASGGAIENLLGKKADGTPITPGDKYPFLYSMSYFSTWGDEGQYDFPNISENLRKESKAHLDWVLKNAKAPDVAWKLDAAQSTLPSFSRVNFDAGADRVNFILSRKTPQEAWQEIIDKYNAMGYQQLQQEINDYAKSIGM